LIPASSILRCSYRGVAVGDRGDAFGHVVAALGERRRERGGDQVADLAEVVGLQAARGERAGADA
jgi:hypothetical protein